ncbi:DUF5363 family protein [Shewanella corallii]|nr:DUF5363 family protein [Shewanella corallii]
MNWLRKAWAKYCDWCDSMGLTPESKRCCAPVLHDPELKHVNGEKPELSAHLLEDGKRNAD